MFSLYAPVIFEFVRRVVRNSTKMYFWNLVATKIMIGMMTETISANFQLMIAMKVSEVIMFINAHTLSTMPQVTSSETRPVSEVTRAIKRPTAFWA